VSTAFTGQLTAKQGRHRRRTTACLPEAVAGSAHSCGVHHLDGLVPSTPPSVIRVGGFTRGELIQLLNDHGVRLNAHSSTLLEHEVFEQRDPEDLRLVAVTVGQMGLARGGTLPEVFEAARERALALCPPDTGPYLRLAWMSQPNAPDSILSAGRSPAGAIKVAAGPLSGDVRYPKGFYVRVIDH